MRNIILLLCCIAVGPGLLAAQDRDPHFQVPEIANIAHESTFLHGYLHGYEEGFHQGDFNLQMGRVARGDTVQDSSPKGYEKDFGPKAMYKSGFHEGFAVGYADAASGRRFRGLQNVMAAAVSIPENHQSESAAFDRGMHLGYLAGQHQGLADARRDVQPQPSPACPLGAEAKPGFCTAYAEGFQIGYSDGFTNQAKTTLAEK